jgi:nucleolar GTP-binding protein
MGDGEGQPKKRIHSSKSRGMSRGRSASLAAPSPSSGLRDAAMGNRAVKMADKAQRKRNKMAKVGEADR